MIFDRFLSMLTKSLELLMGTMMITLTAVTFLQVILRYLFNSPTSWSSELSRFILIWITLTGASVATRRAAHLSMGLSLHRRLPAGAARWLRALINICITGAMIALCHYGYRIMAVTGGAISPGLGLPMYVPWSALPVNAAIMCLFLVGDLLRIFGKRREG